MTNGKILLESQGSMLLGGAVSTSGDLTLSSKAQIYDGENFGARNLADGSANPNYFARYNIFNKTAYFTGIADATPNHYLAQLDANGDPYSQGYGLLVTGQVVSLGEQKSLVLRSDQEVIVRGIVEARGEGAEVTLQSDEFLYVEAFVTAKAGLNLYGGVDVNGVNLTSGGNTSDSRGSSIYVAANGTIRTENADADIHVKGASDVDLFGAIVAGGSIGATGVSFATEADGDGASDILVQAGQQIRLESGLLASGDVTVSGGTPGSDDHWTGAEMETAPSTNPNLLSVLINSSGGITGFGLGADGKGSSVTVTGDERIEIMGTLTAGGRLEQVFEPLDPNDISSEVVMKSQTVDWSGRDSSVYLESSGRIFIGGNTLNEAGELVQTGGYINASKEIVARGGSDAETGFGMIVHAASELVAEGRWDYAADGSRSRAGTGSYSDGLIDLYGVGDVDMQGMLVSGGQSAMQIDAVGKYIGRNIVRYDVDSEIKVRADRQLLVHTDITAGKQVDMIGGTDKRVKAVISASVSGSNIVFTINEAGFGYDERVTFSVTDGSASKEVSATLDADGKITALSVDTTGLDLTKTLSVETNGEDRFYGRGLSLLGSASIMTERANSEINLNAPGRVDLLAPGDVQELVLGGWAYRSDGKMPFATSDENTSDSGDNGYGTFVMNQGAWDYTLKAGALSDLAVGQTVKDTVTFSTFGDFTETVEVNIIGTNTGPTIVGASSGVIETTILVQLDKVKYTAEAAINLTAEETKTFTTISQLTTALNNKLKDAEWVVVQSDNPSSGLTPLLNTVYRGFDAMREIDGREPSDLVPDVSAKLRDGHIRLVSPYEISVVKETSLASAATVVTVFSGDGELSSDAAIGNAIAGHANINEDLLGILFEDTSYGIQRDSDGVIQKVVSSQRFSLDAPGVGSVVNIGAPTGDNGKIYIAGKVRGYSGIVMNTGNAEAGEGVDLDATGILETIDGNIAFDLSSQALLQGDVIARGAGRNIDLSALGQLRIQGLIQADNDVKLTGGVSARSLWIDNTAAVKVVDAGGSIELLGANQVFVDGTVETLRADQEISIQSTQGEVLLNETSGRINAAGLLDITGIVLTLQGPITSSFNSNSSTAEVSLTAADAIDFGTQLEAHHDAQVLITYGGTMSMVDTLVDVGTLNIVGGHLTMGATVDGVRRGASVMAAKAIDIGLWGDLTIDPAVSLVASDQASNIVIDVNSIDILGTVHAGAEIVDGSVRASGNASTVQITAADQISLGSRGQTTTAYSGVIRATGNITLNGGSGYGDTTYPGMGLWVDANSTVESLNIAEDASALITLNTTRDMTLNGFVLAKESSGVIDINADRKASIAGVITGHSTVNISAGLTDTLGYSVLTAAVDYKMNLAVSDVNGVQKIAADQYFVDENGKLMDSQGRVVIDNSGTAVVETKASDNSRVAAVVAAGASVSVGSGVGGAPIRLFGSIIDTAIGGTINIDGTGVLDLDGNIGQVYSDASLTPPTGANPTAINIQGLGTEQVHLRGDFNAHDTLKITGEDINVLEGALLKTWTAGSTLDIIGAGNILVQAQQLETGLGNATISSADTAHVRGKTIYISGDINAAKTAWINASRDVSVYGSISAKTGDATTLVHIRAGLANSVADATAAGASVVASSLGSGSIFVMGAANIKSDGTVNLDAGTDVVLDASASATAGDRTVQTPVLSTKTVTSQVITGYTQVVDGVIDVPVVKWVDTTVTEQVGLESVKVGYTYTTMDVTLNQLGYFNGTEHREYFIEGFDYRNSANSANNPAGNATVINWSGNGLAAPSETYVEYKPGSSAIFSDYREPTFGELNDAQRALVLSTLGYKPVYSFEASNLEIHRVVNGNASKGVWTPSWSLPLLRVKNDLCTGLTCLLMVSAIFGSKCPLGQRMIWRVQSQKMRVYYPQRPWAPTMILHKFTIIRSNRIGKRRRELPLSGWQIPMRGQLNRKIPLIMMVWIQFGKLSLMVEVRLTEYLVKLQLRIMRIETLL